MPLRACVVSLVLSLAIGCGGPDRTPAPRADASDGAASADAGVLQPVVLPDLSRLEAQVQAQVRDEYARLQQLQQTSGAPPLELGRAHGAMGKLLMAAEYHDVAEVYFRNARVLDPGDYRWPYYLAHIYKARGQLPEAVALFEEARSLQPNDAATLVWLGELHLTAGRPEAAEPLFARARQLQPQSLAPRFGLGRVALAQKNFGGAIEHLESALALDRQAVSIHYPLAMAYRGAGDAARAEYHLKRQGKFEIAPPDPLMQELRELLHSAISYEVEGIRELNSGRWENAAARFRMGLELNPSSASLRHRLGTALYMLGRSDEARDMFERVVRESPEYSKAHYSLGVLFESSGRLGEAFERYTTALRYEPGYLEARVRLAGVLRAQGKLRESLAEYDRVLAVNPSDAEALFGSAILLVRQRRYDEAHARLGTGRQMHAGDPRFAHALARLLAAAPDARLRDGGQALSLMQALPDAQRRLDMGETMAMVLAEVGQYAEAATWQRGAVAAARAAGNAGLARRMEASLRLYEAGQPSRTPWRDEDLP